MKLLRTIFFSVILFGCQNTSTNKMETIKNLKKTEYDSIEGIISLKTWDNFKLQKHWENEIDISFDIQKENPSITKEQENTFNYIFSNQETIKNHLLSRLYKEYDEIQNIYGDFKGTEYEPHDIKFKEEFSSLIQLVSIGILLPNKDGICNVGYSFACKWDPEHGVGFMTSLEEIIAFGGADQSF
jgi:hypothetical protein